MPQGAGANPLAKGRPRVCSVRNKHISLNEQFS
ncbi:hypothetical protein ACVWZK_008545 [Bradyrhizobium sp. GM0.4]